MNKQFKQLVYNTGLSDFLRGRDNCPKYWRNKPEERIWRAGWTKGKKSRVYTKPSLA